MGMENDPDILGRAPNVRASDADRDRVRLLLRRHHRDGRLTAEELAQRTDRVNAATTFGELDAIMANLPRLPPPPVGHPPRQRLGRPGKGSTAPSSPTW